MLHANMRMMEAMTINAYPALQELHYDGWLLRFAQGFTRRANAVYVIGESTLPLDEKIDYVESMYRQRGLMVVFKLTGRHEDDPQSPLEQALVERGYVYDTTTSLFSTPLTEPIAPVPNAQVESALSDAWLLAFGRLESVSVERLPLVREMRERLALPVGYVSIRDDDGTIIALAEGVVEREWVGIYSVVVDSAVRGRGLGRAIMRATLAWGQQQGANSAYLQVRSDNPIAISLYQSLGFKEVYRYWYRQKA